MVKISVAKRVTILLLLETISRTNSAKEKDSTVEYQGLYSGTVDGYEVVIPLKLVDGVKLSHGLRHRRSWGPLQYKLKIAGRWRHVELNHNDGLVGPALLVERAGARRPPAAPTDCHYTGTLREYPNSSVAISACNDGLVGLIRMGNEEYWLEPAREHGQSTGKPHLLYKRAKQQQAPSLRHGKKHKNRKKNRKHSSCGTREPRRKTLQSSLKKKVVWVKKRTDKYNSRPRRSVSQERHVEVLVVADSTMVDFHKDSDLETYLLTIMNMVSSTYQDPSIGNYINIVVVKIILLEDDVKEGLNITINADQALKNFCKWQMERNPTEEQHPNHHDVAILVTRKDICSRKNIPCSTLGVSQVGGMCKPDRSCNLNEDNGITLAHTITHELGHNFGMYHDTPQAGCEARKGSVLHVMTPNFEADTTHIAWSGCSRRDITLFLDQGMGDCLEDLPSPDPLYSYPELPPGAVYNADHQCKFQFGSESATVCSPLEEICTRLWCMVDGICSSMLYPAAPGTHCGKFKWCLNQKCVTIGEKPDPINGEWGAWSGWSECSRTCGGGVTTRERHCNNPVPAFEGKFCIGQRQKYKVCNTQPCPEGAQSFRAEQCSVYNDQLLDGKSVTFKPHFEKDEPCNLYCSESRDVLIEPFGDSALDGTPCNLGRHDMCIGGICRKVGCDWVVDSEAMEDKCGVCLGNGSQCTTIRKEFNKHIGSGVTEVVVIPENSRNILIEEKGSFRNFISIQGSKKKKFYLNGKRDSSISGEFEVAGVIGLYECRKDREKVKIPGPIREPIIVNLSSKGKSHNTALLYEYSILKETPAAPKKYAWEFEWSACSKSCGHGVQKGIITCFDTQLHQKVKEDMCGEKPYPLTRSCNEFPCPTRWWVGPWQPCSVSCGSGVKGRTVMCLLTSRDQAVAVADTQCDIDNRPPETAPCAKPQPCTPNNGISNNNTWNTTSEYPLRTLGFHSYAVGKSKWMVHPWEACSASCGQGYQKRVVICSQFSKSCDHHSKPPDVRSCSVKPC